MPSARAGDRMQISVRVYIYIYILIMMNHNIPRARDTAKKGTDSVLVLRLMDPLWSKQTGLSQAIRGTPFLESTFPPIYIFSRSAERSELGKGPGSEDVLFSVSDFRYETHADLYWSSTDSIHINCKRVCEIG